MPVTPLDHRGQGENYRLGRRLSKRGDANTPRNSSKWRRFYSPAGTVEEWWGVEPVSASQGATQGWWSTVDAGEGWGLGGSAVVSVCGIGWWPCRHFREEFSQEIRLPPALSFQCNNVQAFLWPGGRLARWPTAVGGPS